MIRRHWILKLSLVILAGMALHGTAEAQFNRAIVGSGSWDNAGSWQLGVPTGSHDATIGTTSAPGVSPSSITMDGAGVRTSNGLWMGVFANNTNGTLTMTNGATLNTGFMNLAENSNTNVLLSLTDSTLTSGNNLRMAWNSGSVGTITLTDSSMTNNFSGEGLARLGGSATVNLINSTWTFGGGGEFRNATDGNAGTKSRIVLDDGEIQSSITNFFRNRNATTTNANSGAEIFGNGLINSTNGNAFQNNGRVVANGGTLTIAGFNVMSTAEGLSNVEGGFYGSNGWFAQDGTGNAKVTLPTLNFASRKTWGDGNFATDTTPDLVNSVHFNVTAGTVTGNLLGSLLATDHTDVPAGLINPIGVWDFSGLSFGGGSSLQMVIRYDNANANLTFDPADLKLFHYDGSTWDEILGTVDTTNRRFTSDAGAITSLSQFALAEDFEPPSVVPEPSTYALGLMGLAGLGLLAWRRKRRIADC